VRVRGRPRRHRRAGPTRQLISLVCRLSMPFVYEHLSYAT
jgi:hypothetical protein